jgi:hypothetical protein
MPGKPLDEREFVCLGMEGLYKFMLLKDLEDRIVWKNSTPPGCYAADMVGTSNLILWELEGDRWEISKTDTLWSEWFGKPNDITQWNSWSGSSHPCCSPVVTDCPA